MVFILIALRTCSFVVKFGIYKTVVETITMTDISGANQKHFTYKHL